MPLYYRFFFTLMFKSESLQVKEDRAATHNVFLFIFCFRRSLDNDVNLGKKKPLFPDRETDGNMIGIGIQTSLVPINYC
jgi:hypothetical protein